MSARSKKTRSADVVSTKTTAPSTPNNNAKTGERSSSPLSITRHEEREELAYLNNRLAGYIDYVRNLETDKEQLTKKIKLISEEKFGETDKMKKAYEDELASLRALVDDLANEKAKLEIEAKSAREEYRDAKSGLSKAEAMCNSLDRKVEQMERELAHFRSSTDRVEKLKSDNDALRKKTDNLKKDLDAETLLRTELENRVTSLKEELEFRDRINEEETSMYGSKAASIEMEISSRKAQEYESRLAEELRMIRAQTAEEMEDYKMELEAAFESQLNQFKNQNSDGNSEAARYRDELMSLRRKYDEAMSSISSKSGELESMRKKNHEFQKQIERERESFEDQLKIQRDEINRLNQEIAKKVKEFSELLHIKITLDQEILMYRKMLEGEESRLKISTPPRDSSFNIRTSKKRRFDSDGDIEESYGSFLSGSPVSKRSSSRRTYGYQVITKTNEDSHIEFDKTQDGRGNYIRICNNSKSAVNISGWVLSQMTDGDQVSYTFPPGTNARANSITTIWSHNSPSAIKDQNNIIMSNKSFIDGSNVSLKLVNKSDKEQASCTITRELVCSTSRMGKDGQEERCSIM